MHGEHTDGRSTDSDGVIDVDDLPDGLVVTDRDGHVLTVNRAATRLTGVTRDQAAGRHLRDAFSFRDHDGRDWWKWLDTYGGLSTRTRQPELPLRTPDGQEMLVAARLVRRPETSATNPDFKKVYDHMVAFRNDQYLWWQVAEYSYDTFMIRTRLRT